ncbi:MAG: hypothetical protein P4L56_07770 [Candidatus Sulfopaludibacter sp.]|nr:hypothetical protein [Candidatus Sulfopaludibacter sp.]
MNGRTCQLCGKPLSRIWAGGGGDFCSREHRNQYRLRCGMDTLLEANKHASLMRRRDTPRQFPLAQLQSNSAAETRPFGPIRPAVRRPELRPLPVPTSLANARFQTGDSRFLPPAAAGASSAQARFASRPGARSANRLAPLPLRPRKMPVALAQAAAVPVRFNSDAAPGARRSFVMLAHPSPRPVISARAFRSLALEPLGNISTRRAHTLKLAGKVGNAFRVSSSKGFRLPKLALRQTASAGPATNGLRFPEILTLRRAAHTGRSIVAHPAERDFPVAAVCPPAFHQDSPRAGLESAAPLPLSSPSPRGNRLDRRDFAWRSPALEGQLLLRRSGLRAGQASTAPGCRPLKLAPAGAGGAPRLGHAPFEPQDKALISMSYPWNASR